LKERRKNLYLYSGYIFFIFYLLVFSVFLPVAIQAVEMTEVEDGPLVTIMFFETDLREALNEISLQSGINIIADQTVSGTVSADLVEVPLEKVLRMILIGGGYTYRKIEDFYFVGLPDIKNTSFSSLSELEIVELKYINVEKVLDILPSSLEAYVEGNRQGDVLTINAPAQQMGKIKEIITKVDQPGKQVEVNVLVTEIDSRYFEEYGSELFSFFDTENPNKGFSYDMASNLLFIQGDVYGQLLSKIKILQEEKKASIEADPRVIVAEGETAELFIGDQQILLINLEDDDIASRVEKVEVGVGLKVTAERIADENIVLNIAPELSHFVAVDRPDIIIKQNSVSTTVNIKNGETIVLAGMTISDNSTKSEKIPVLSDIPILRWFFKTERTEEAESELLVFVTPVIR